jgi:hypothetical protein
MTQRTRWDAPRDLDSPNDLAKLLAEVKEAVCTGELNQITLPSEPFATKEDVQSLLPGGPWPDYLELYFEDGKTGKRYRLVAETYHGCGGRWEKAP